MSSFNPSLFHPNLSQSLPDLMQPIALPLSGEEGSCPLNFGGKKIEIEEGRKYIQSMCFRTLSMSCFYLKHTSINTE
jgi:hypothetical protein